MEVDLHLVDQEDDGKQDVQNVAVVQDVKVDVHEDVHVDAQNPNK